MIEIKGKIKEGYDEILTSEALEFLEGLHDKFEPVRERLLRQRDNWQKRFNKGHLPDFLPQGYNIRENAWMVAPIPDDMQKRHVEITGPVSRKMVINALNSGADCFMADFEDSNSPTWENCMDGQLNLRDAVNRNIELETEKKHYKLNDSVAKLMVRPRGWHLDEKNCIVNGQRISASLFDFGLFAFHNMKTQHKRGETPAFYLPKVEHYLEAGLWNDVFKYTQDRLGIPQGTIRATVLIETLPAVFQMHEILHELREHSAGLNAGRWDYIFSAIKCLGKYKQFIYPDRALVSMETHMMESYAKLLIQTCHRRGIHAIGGMSAYIPTKDDSNKFAIAKVATDKFREAALGHDGTWVAHPGLVDVARNHMREGGLTSENQIDQIDDIIITQADLLKVPKHENVHHITDGGLINNIDVCLRYMASWLTGLGCVPLYGLMEDLATAEISRAQLWQWAKHKVKVGNMFLTKERLVSIINRQAAHLESEGYTSESVELATNLLVGMVTSDECPSFISSVAYKHLE